MCESVYSWVEDQSVEDNHKMIPVQCNTYIAALERLIASGCADITDLEKIQASFGISSSIGFERKA